MTSNNSLSTEELMRMLFRETDPRELFAEYEDDFALPALHDYLADLVQQRSEKPANVIARTSLEKSYGYQVFAGNRNPSRDTCLQLAIALEADVDQTQELLRIAHKSALYPRIKRDALIIAAINRHLTILETNNLLHDSELPLLGEMKHD